MKPEYFRHAEPRLLPEQYFLGRLRAWGIFQDRLGHLRRQFVVDITGSVDGDTLTLDEAFQYSDGATEQRVWAIVRTGEHRYEGRAEGVIGRATGLAYGNALNWQYDFELKAHGRVFRVHFDDWMFLQPDGVLINRARVSKFGLSVGEVSLFFRHTLDVAGGDGAFANGAADAGVPPQTALAAANPPLQPA